MTLVSPDENLSEGEPTICNHTNTGKSQEQRPADPSNNRTRPPRTLEGGTLRGDHQAGIFK